MTARFLGPEGKGFIYLLIVSISISVAFGNFGLGPASIYFIGKDRKYLPATLTNLLVATGVISVVLVSLGWLLLQYGRPNIYAQFPLWMWAIVALLIPIHLIQSFFMQVLSAILRIREINFVDIARVSAQLLLFVLLVVIIGTGVKGAFFAYALSAFFAAGAFFLLALYQGGRPAMPDWRLFVASLRFGGKAYLSNLIRLLNLRLNMLLVASLAVRGIQSIGIYSVASSLAELLLYIPTSIRLSLFPMVSASSTTAANRLTPMACRHTMFLTVILALALGAIGAVAIPQLYGEAFAGAIIPLLLLLPGTVMLSQTIIIYSDLIGRGKPGFTVVSTLLSLVVTVTLGFVLIPLYGITGAAVAFSTAHTVELLVAGSLFIRHSGLPWKSVFVFQRSDLRQYLHILPEVLRMMPAHRTNRGSLGS